MKIDTEQIEYDFTVKEIDGFLLVNPAEIGNEIACKMIETAKVYDTDIYEAELYDEANEYMKEIIFQIVNDAIYFIEQNNIEVK